MMYGKRQSDRGFRNRGGTAPWRGAGVLLICAGVLVFAVPAPGQDSVPEVRKRVNLLLAQGDYMAVIPDLQQLIDWMGESKDARIEASLEMVYFNLGLSHFFIGQFGEAQKALEGYLKKYKYGAMRSKAAVYIADSMRFKGELSGAIAAYNDCLKRYQYTPDWRSDIFTSLSRCYLAEGNWKDAEKPLLQVYRFAPDWIVRNWAATLLTTSYLKSLDLDKVYGIVPYILRPGSFASRSVAFNMAALEAGDGLFADERYREALWIYRLVYPHDLVMVRSEEYLELLQAQAERMRNGVGEPRELMRVQENIAELEAELKALQEIDNYDLDLHNRIARGYMEFQRYWEGREIFLYLHGEADKAVAEESLFLAFQCSAHIQPWDRAFEIGEMYMRVYPSGEFFDLLTLAMGQMYARLQDWPAVIRHMTRALEMSPRHESAAECMFLIGYASFMEEKFPDAIAWLTRLNSEYPGNDLADEAIYWTGMSFLYNREYEPGAKEFDRLLVEYPECRYVEDAGFRRAVCAYGMSLFEECDERLAAFIGAYPQSQLAGEALMMRGDVAGAFGQLKEAVAFYQQSMAFPDLNIEFYNHCAFQAGNILNDEGDQDGMRQHFTQYIQANREGANIPQAVYWVGIALWNKGEQQGALRFYRAAVEKYGKDPSAIGIDMILDEWIGRIRQAGAEQAKTAWAEQRAALEKAISENNVTLALRLKRVMLYNPEILPSELQSIHNDFAGEKALPAASPAVLQTMMDLAAKRADQAATVRIAEEIIERYMETDYALDARMILARMAIEKARAAGGGAGAQKHYDDAIRHLGVIREVFAASSEAAEALILLGQLHREQEQWASADECYKSVLGVKAWRNYWPEALYGRGECHFAQRQYDQASAYFERIYLLYSHYGQWTAKAYLRRAECLQKMYQVGKAREVLAEMLRNPDLQELPERNAAQALMAKLGSVE